MSSCYCPSDFERLSPYQTSRRCGAGAGVCDECKRLIGRGEVYEHARGKHEGTWTTYRTCVYCLAMRDLIETRVTCFCWRYTALREDIRYLLEDDGDRLPGLGFALGRLELERRADRQYQEGQ